MPPINDLIKLALALTERSAGQSIGRASMRIAGIAIACIAAFACIVTAAACVLAALWIYTLPQLGPVGAPLVVAGVLLVLSVGILGTIKYAVKSRRPVPPADVAPALLLAEATRLIKTHKGPVLLAALLIGIAAGSNEK